MGTLFLLIIGLYVFALSIFLGFEVITKVPPTLHTPLMSGANAISGITIVGAIVCASTNVSMGAQILAFIAVITAMVNVVGGFMVTDRMLEMFGPKKPAPAPAAESAAEPEPKPEPKGDDAAAAPVEVEEAPAAEEAPTAEAAAESDPSGDDA